MMWYQKRLDDVFSELGSEAKAGISQIEATARIKQYGKNILPHGKKVTWIQFLFRQFKSPLVYILLIAAALTTWMALLPETSELAAGEHGEENRWVDTIVILLAIAVNVAVGFWQEFRSNTILEKLEEVVRTNAFVIRDSEMHEINAEMLVPGDVILLKAGKKVPADARIISQNKLEINESILTGESAPVGKRNIDISGDVVVGDRENMVHMGTLVARGDGRAVVTSTGADSAFGKIALMTQTAEEEPTPLQLRMGRLGTLLAWLMGVASLVIFGVGVVNEYSVVEMVTTAVAVAVAAIPEGLPAGISIILAVSAQKILRRKGVVKKLVAAEALGSASVICTDKTGTLTEGKMVIKRLVTGGATTDATAILALANEAVVEEIEGKKIARGETTDEAKLQYFLDSGEDFDALHKKYPRISLLTFNPENKYIASLHGSEDGKTHLFLNGAPEVLLELSDFYVGEGGNESRLSEKERKRFHQEYEELAGNGYRVLGLARRTFVTLEGGEQKDLEDVDTRRELVQKLVFVGYAAIRDPIRDDVRESIKEARSAGIKVIMMTGDHLLTARAIGGDLGFSKEEGAVFEGKIIETLSDEELSELVKKAEIFARVNPEHKMRVINALQKNDEVVAMTGDGINDAPALKSADIGVAVGSGTDIAKAASDLILLNDSFSVIVESIRQGRIAFDNIRKVTVFLLAGSFTEIVIIMVPLLMGLEYLPLTAVLILWTNLVEDSLPNIALSFEPGEKDVMKRPPVKKNEPVLDKESKIIVFAIGLITDFVLLAIFLYFYFAGTMTVEHLQTLIFAGLGLDTFFYVFAIKNLRKSIFSYNIFSNKLLVGATILGVGLMLSAIYIPWLGDLLGTEPLTVSDWIIIVSLGLVKLLGVELVKWWFIHRDLDNGDKRNVSGKVVSSPTTA